MHDIMPPLGADAQVIQSYGPESFRIGNAVYASPVLVLPAATLVWDGALTMESLTPLITAEPKPEVVLIGTGKRHVLVSAELRAALKREGIATDTMDTGAACRTFNILLGEGRRVAAVLPLPV